MENFITSGLELTLPIVLLLIWTTIWKAFGLWNAAKKDNRIIFILILILNTAGILPIAYLLYLKYSKEDKIEKIKKTSKKNK